MTKVKKNQIIEVEIENIAFGGKGLAKLDGYTLFIDQAVPGDLAAVRITKKKKFGNKKFYKMVNY